jgi:hypothetical protein
MTGIRRAAWWGLVREHPRAYVTYRWTVMKELLGITDSLPWEPVCQTIAASSDQLRSLEQ